MEYKPCEVISIYKKEIIYKNIRHRRYRVGAMLSLMLIIPLVVLGFIRYNDTVSSNLYEQVYSLASPNYMPSVDYSGIIFTDAEAYLISASEIDFLLPVTPQKVEEDGDKLLLTTSENLVLVAPEKGVVSSVANNNGIKFIKILHSTNIESIIENIDLSGVEVGNIVNRGQEIGTVKKDTIIKFKIEQNGKAIENISFKDNKVLWEE